MDPQATQDRPAGHPAPLHAHYFDPAIPIAERLRASFFELGIGSDERSRIMDLMGALKTGAMADYEHSVRVGLLASRIAGAQQMDRRALFYAGLLHHLGYERVRGSFDFSADIILWSERFRAFGSKGEAPGLLHHYSMGTRSLIPRYGRMLALADCFDALHGIEAGNALPPDGEEVRNKLYFLNPDLKDLLDRLFKMGVLSTFVLGDEHRETAELDRYDALYAESFSFTPVFRTPQNTARHVMLAASLEPISDKEGCTTRFTDASRHLRLEYFITAAVNLGDAFAALGAAVEACCGRLPDVYQYAYRAQIESKRNRRGGRVNQGIIELLTPIVAAQHRCDPDYRLEGQQILEEAHKLLTLTSKADVEALVRMKRTAYALSHYEERTVPDRPEAQNVLQYYERELVDSRTPTSIAHNAEFVRGFPTVALMCTTFRACPYPFFSRRVEEAYHLARARHHADVGVGFLADCVAAMIYLELSQHPRDRLIG